MEQIPQRKGMSKGCLVSLIVAGALLLILIIITVTCYVKRDDLTRFGTVSIITELKRNLNAKPVSGVDTVKFDALADAFVKKLNESKPPMEEMAKFVQKIQLAATNKTPDSATVAAVSEAMISFYPELETDLQAPAPADTTAPGEGGETK